MQDITVRQLSEKTALIARLRQYTASDVTEQQEDTILAILEDAFENFYGLQRPDIITEIQRVTVNRRLGKGNARLKNISFLKYPPSNLVTRYGRCNIKYHSVLYAAFNYLTILSELKPEAGDLITISTWVNSGEIPMGCASVIGKQPENSVNLNTLEVRQQFEQDISQLPTNQRELVNLQTEFLADVFSRLVQPGAHLNYIFSAFFADLVFNSVGLEAIIYPSVQQRLSFDNIAITPAAFERTFQLKEAREMIVLDSPFGEHANSSGALSHVTATAKSIQADGQLDWVNSYGSDKMSEFKREFYVDFD